MLAPLLALALMAAPTSIPLKAEQLQLPNGLRVILSEDHSVPGVTVQVGYLVGSRDEVPGRTGFAHLFEHLMFMGSTHVPYPQFDTIMESSGGTNNADTSDDRTVYYESGPSPLLETFLWMEADRLHTLADAMTDEKVQAQRLVVQNERRQSYENRPYGMVDLEMFKALFPPQHPYSWPTIGSHADLEAASTADVVAFFKRFYTPANAVLTVVGDFETAQAKQWVVKYFGWMPSRPADARPSPPQPVLAAPKALTLKDKVELPKVVWAWHSPPEGSAGDAEADLLAVALGANKSGRLYRELVNAKGLAQEAYAIENSTQLGSVFVVSVLAQPGHTPAELEKATQAVVARMADEGPTQAELDAAMLQIRTRLATQAEGLESRARLLFTLWERYGDANAIDRELGRYQAATVESVKKRAQAILRSQPVVITVIPSTTPNEAKP